MVEWWSAISSFEKIFWVVAFPSSTLFIIQVVLTFLGLEHSIDMHGDILGDTSAEVFDSSQDHSLTHSSESSADVLDVKLKLVTIRSVITFFTVFSWTGIATVRAGISHVSIILISAILGLVIMVIVSFIYYSAARLTEIGTMDIKNAIGQKGHVYLAIPKEGEGTGQVTVVIQGVLRVMDAITYGEKIPTGDKIIVIKIVEDQLLLVEKID